MTDVCLQSHYKHWKISFVLTCWGIWHWRNDRIFNEAIVYWNQKASRPKRCMEEIAWAWMKVDALQNKLPFKHKVLIRWNHPDYWKLKINIDRATKCNPGLAGAGSAIRDAQRR